MDKMLSTFKLANCWLSLEEELHVIVY